MEKNKSDLPEEEEGGVHCEWLNEGDIVLPEGVFEHMEERAKKAEGLLETEQKLRLKDYETEKELKEEHRETLTKIKDLIEDYTIRKCIYISDVITEIHKLVK